MIEVSRRVSAIIGSIVLGALTFGVAQVYASSEHDHHAGANATATPQAGTPAKLLADPYPLTTCPVTGEELGGMGDPVIYNYKGREIRFCCQGCVKPFEKEPAKYIAEIDAQIIKDQLAHYPLDTCVVSEAKLGDMGEPVNMVWNNRLVRFCCSGCVKDFEADPTKYIKVLDAAVVKAQTADYPLDHCIVLTDEKIGGKDTVDFVVANRLFRLCCQGCKDDIKADPAKYIQELDAAAK